MNIHYFFDKDTATFTYIVSDTKTGKCAVIDPVLSYDIYSGTTSTKPIDQVINYIKKHSLKIEWIIDTHAHADHLTGSYYLKKELGGKIGIGENIKKVLKFWIPLFNNTNDTPYDGSQFDYLFKDEEIFSIGSIEVKVMHTPGHTPACNCYLIGKHIFVGDTILMPYVGTARTDFPGGSAETLYNSIHKILSLPENTTIYTCHDYPPEGKEPNCISTVGQQRKENIMINEKVTKEEYIKERNAKDKGKPVPKLLLPSLQVNIRAGSLGEAADNNIKYIKTPLNQNINTTP